MWYDSCVLKDHELTGLSPQDHDITGRELIPMTVTERDKAVVVEPAGHLHLGNKISDSYAAYKVPGEKAHLQVTWETFATEQNYVNKIKARHAQKVILHHMDYHCQESSRDEDFKQLKLKNQQKLVECRQRTNNQPLFLYRDFNRKK